MTAPLENIPAHLQEYITEQDPTLYTPIDHASWRYIMRVSKAFFEKTAHPLYLKGLEATGISTERVPLVAEMDAALRKMGWRAVAINGFIPPAVFLEFQSLKILAIACDMRKLENLGYTPSPDIVHEAAGHAPIVADPKYRRYLEAYGEVARNAIINKYDLELYDAIYKLSELKESTTATADQLATAQKQFETLAAKGTEPSEAALLARMAWWTTEYGLVGTKEKPLIYGAGLLSSVEESFNYLKSPKIVPFALDAVLRTSYDITRPQPQLFLSENFEVLTAALEQFSMSMAYRLGGIHGLNLAKAASNTVTAQLDNGMQFSGILSNFEQSEKDGELSFTMVGAKQISYGNKTGHEISHHNLGPTVYIPFFDKTVATAALSDIQRKLHGTGLVTKGGDRMLGRFKKEVTIGGRVRVLVLENVRVVDKDGKVKFEEKARDYPLVIANKVISVFGGAADRAEFAMRGSIQKEKTQKPLVKKHKTNKTEENAPLCRLYQAVRTFRESRGTEVQHLDATLRELNDLFPHDWLLRLEFYELYKKLQPTNVMTAKIRQALVEIQERKPALRDLIDRGLKLVE